ncbi:MAG: mRNA surveillance protein pelota [Candidatus Hodarchaeales archaeon]
MRTLHKDLRHGLLKLKPLTATDLYVLSNVLEPGDHVSARSVRRVHRKGQEGRSGDKGERVPVFLTLDVEEANFHESTAQPRLRIRGRILEGPDDLVSVGSWHTFNIEIGSVLSIKKKEWTSYHFKLLEEAQQAAQRSKIGLMVIDTGHMTMAVVDNFQVRMAFQERFKIPRKASRIKTREEAIGQFFRFVAEAVNRLIDNEKLVHLVIGGPGFTKDHFLTFLDKNQLRPDIPIQMETTSSALASGVGELVSRGTIDRLAAEYSVVQERKILDEFLTRMGKGIETVAYGLDNVHQAAQMGAVEKLLVLDTLLRSQEESQKEVIQTILKQTESGRGHLRIVTATSENGEQLEGLGGTLALLRFPIYYE